MSHYKPYPAYKDSGVEWLGEVPAHWIVQPTKYVINAQSGGQTTKNTVSSEPLDGLFPAFSASGQDVWMDEYEFDCAGIVLSAVGARCGKTFKADGKWGVVANTHCLFPTGENSRNYLWYLTNRESWWEKGGTAQPFIKVVDTLDRKNCFPLANEQRVISDHLDRETTRIDTLIAKKTRFIELLKEKRQALITQAVTKGLNPNLKMKDSGVEWLGEVPEHWSAGRFAYYLDLLVDGTHQSPENLHEGDVPYITAKNIKEGGFDLDDLTFVSRSVHNEIFRRCPVRRGDILYIKDGATAGVAMINRVDYEFSMLSSVALLRVGKNINNEFIAYLLNSKALKDAQLSTVVGGAITRMTLEMIGNFGIPVPPISEQISIVKYLNSGTNSHEMICKAVNRSIALLKERRSSLITAAVTGQIDLRDQ